MVVSCLLSNTVRLLVGVRVADFMRRDHPKPVGYGLGWRGRRCFGNWNDVYRSSSDR